MGSLPTINKFQNNPEISIEELSAHIQFLASDSLKGRFPGTPESEIAAKYITDQMKQVGILPAGEENYRQYFDFVSNLEIGEKNTLYTKNRSFSVSSDYMPLGFSGTGFYSGGVAFVGYGFSINDSIQWNDYANIEMKNKWALILRGGPERDNPHSDFEKHIPLRKKVLTAKDNGALGVLFVSPIDPEEKDELIRLRYDQSFSGAGIPAIHISQATANALLSEKNIKLEVLQKKLESSRASESFLLPETEISATVSLKKKTNSVPNILGIIPGNHPKLKNEYIVLGAHFDHLGFGGEGSGSLKPDTVAVHNGADDNASGTAGLLEVGERLAANKHLLKRSVLLMAYNAEEEGLLGSKYFTKNPTIALGSVAAMINMDMIGRMSENKVTIGGTGTAPNFETLLNNVNKDHNLVLKMSPEGYGPSDHASFYVNDIPVLFFFTGTHDDYHRPSDDWEKINFEGEKQISEFIYETTVRLSALEEKPKFTEAGPKNPQASRRKFKVTFGIIPSYGSQEEGMEIDGAKKDGPAAKAGLKKGDIIVQIGGKEIKNIYDYMYRLAELKKGQVVAVKIRRGDRLLELSIQL